MTKAWSFLVVLLLSGCSVFGIRTGTEEPRYALVQQTTGFEIRRYGPRVEMSTVVASDENEARYQGFRRLAGYIFGANKARAKIAMTAPVAQNPEKIAMTAPVAERRDSSGGWRIAFYAPSGYTLDTMPVPDNPAVELRDTPAVTVAIRRFTGDRSPAAVARETANLMRDLQGSGWRASGPGFVWFYDPPWTLPFLRRNEVGVPAEAVSSP
jgi:SOUL heme-binding protein